MMADREAEGEAEDGRPPFGPEANLSSGGGGGGGGDIVREGSAPMTLKDRANANVRLCGRGVLAGAGMFNESYFLFAIGNLELIWEALYPECYEAGNAGCKNGVVASLTYLEVLGVIAGMLSFGYVADTFGRRIGSCLTAIIMCVCGILTAAAYAQDLTGQWIFFAVALFFFSYGVGGEFPLASASAAEKAEVAKKKKSLAQQIRGKSVVFTFAMQGVGNFSNTLFIILIMLGQGCTGPAELCSDRSLELTWRLQYAIGAVFLVALVVGRVLFLRESAVWSANKEKNAKPKPQPSTSLGGSAAEDQARDVTRRKRRRVHLVLEHYWHRLLGASVGWFVWDAIYYGNKLFQNTILAAIIGRGSTVFRTLQYALINSAIALVALYLAAFFIDKPWMGRRRMQSLGFLVMFVVFLICHVAYDELAKPENVGWFQALYYLTTFFGQFGPNATTWLLPSELFPTDMRSQAHGVSASVGKLGALFAALLLTYGADGGKWSVKTIFLFCAVCGFVGLIVTEVFVPDVSSMDMSHTDDQWEFILAGRAHEYRGEASNPRYLSWYERFYNDKLVSHQNPADPDPASSEPSSPNPAQQQLEVGDAESASTKLAQV